MNIRTRLAGGLLTLLSPVAMVLATAVPAEAATVRVRATFSSPRTDGLSKVTGRLTVVQADGGTVIVRGVVTGLPAWSAFVAVPYVGKGCLPVPGVTAFPSAPTVSDASGTARFNAAVNPRAINPLGTFSAAQTGSVSVRAVVLPARTVPGSSIGVPTIPNVAAVEACDSSPQRIS